MYSLRIVAVSVLSRSLVDAVRIGEDDALAPKTPSVDAAQYDVLLDDAGVGPGHPSQKVKQAGLLQASEVSKPIKHHRHTSNALAEQEVKAAEDSHDYEDDYSADTNVAETAGSQPCADGTINPAAAPAAPCPSSNGPAASLQQGGAQAPPAQPCPAAAQPSPAAAQPCPAAAQPSPAAAQPCPTPPKPCPTTPPPCAKEAEGCGAYDYDDATPCNPCGCDQNQMSMAQVARNALDALAQTQRELAEAKKMADQLKCKESAEFKKKLADVEGEEEAKAELAEEKRLKQTLTEKAEAEKDRNRAAEEKAEASALANFTAAAEKEAEERAKLKEEAREEARAELVAKDRQQAAVKEGTKEAEKARASNDDAIKMIKSEEAKERKMVDAMKGMKSDLEKARAKDRAKASAKSSSMAEVGKKTTTARKSHQAAKAKAQEEEPVSPNTASLSRHSAKDVLTQLKMKN